jgi:hypothetical protein
MSARPTPPNAGLPQAGLEPRDRGPDAGGHLGTRPAIERTTNLFASLIADGDAAFPETFGLSRMVPSPIPRRLVATIDVPLNSSRFERYLTR